VLAHRIIVSPAARLRDVSSDRIMQEIIQPRLLPGGAFVPEAGRRNKMKAGRILIALLFAIGMIGVLSTARIVFTFPLSQCFAVSA
jgi:hypothetical protein